MHLLCLLSARDLILSMSSSKHGAAVYQETKAALPSMFSLKPSKVALFKTKLESRADASGWKSNAQGITKFDNQDNLPVNLIWEYGKIDMATLTSICKTFITGNQSDAYRAQNNRNALDCLIASLDEDEHKCVLANHSNYTIESQAAFPFLYKTLMHLATLDSTATNAALCTIICNCKVFAHECDWDIDKMNS